MIRSTRPALPAALVAAFFLAVPADAARPANHGPDDVEPPPCFAFDAPKAHLASWGFVAAVEVPLMAAGYWLHIWVKPDVGTWQAFIQVGELACFPLRGTAWTVLEHE